VSSETVWRAGLPAKLAVDITSQHPPSRSARLPRRRVSPTGRLIRARSTKALFAAACLRTGRGGHEA